MDLLDLMLSRRSIRAFSSEPVSASAIERIIEAGMLAPNGKGLRPWHFIAIDDPETIARMRGCRIGGPKMLDTATAAVAVLTDSAATDTGIEDSSAALASMQLMAHALNLGSCWMQVRLRPSETPGVSSEDHLRAVLRFPEQMRLEAVLVLGHPAEEPAPHTLDELPYDRIHHEIW